MLKGSCLCGKVTYEIEGELGPGFFCHCQRCRKANGSVFAANARIDKSQFKLLSGADVLKGYLAPTGLVRKFCGECGSPIVSERNEPPMLAVRLGTLDTPLSEVPVKGHIFVNSKSEWLEIHDDLPQFPERPVMK
jgi:Uncharacterized conserved protein